MPRACLTEEEETPVVLDESAVFERLTLKNLVNQLPFEGKGGGTVQTNGVRSTRLRDHERLVARLNNVRVGHVERLRKRDAPVRPRTEIQASGQTDLTPVGSPPNLLKEKVPCSVPVDGEWIRYKLQAEI